MAKFEGEKIFSVDKFLGLNESADGETELKLGEASKIENFNITDDYNLKTRPGVTKRSVVAGAEKIIHAQTVKNFRGEWLLIVSRNETDNWVKIIIENKDSGITVSKEFKQTQKAPITGVKVFSYNGYLHVCFGTEYSGLVVSTIAKCSFDADTPTITQGNCYVPLVMDTTTPDGKGQTRERVNCLNNEFKIQYSADGTSKSYKLPTYTQSVKAVTVDNKTDSTGNFADGTYEFQTAPAKGINNVEFLCTVNPEYTEGALQKFIHMEHSEAYNGATDARLFFYGDGSNVCYYTGVPAFGFGLYLPLGNEITVDFSSSPITGMARNYTSLIGFQTDGAFVINYDPITLEDGTVTAGFYLRNASKEIGNQMNGQVQTVNNYLRTLCNGSLYEWKYTSTQHQDERYTQCISQKIRKTLAKADPGKVVTCDDNSTHTYYMFLNDKEGTVLVNRYDLDVWTVYKGEVFRNVQFAAVYGSNMIFCDNDTVYQFSEDARYDEANTTEGQEQINAVWESGYMSFGAAYRKKYSSTLWVSLLPEHFSELDVTVETDKRDDYITKTIGYLLANFSNVDFSRFSFLTWAAPKIKRVQLKVKKFVYYKLIFRVTKPGARATVLGYDQQVRYSSNVK